MLGDPYGAQNLSARPNVDVPTNHGSADARRMQAHSNLLKNKAINTNCGKGMNDNTIRVRDQQPPTNLAGQRDVGPRDGRPKPVPQDENLAHEVRD
jgi:hypothetical protein